MLWVPSLQNWCPFSRPELSAWPGFWNVLTGFVTICVNAIGLTPHGLCVVTSCNADMSTLCSMSEWLSVQSKSFDVYKQAADMLTSNLVAHDEHHLVKGHCIDHHTPESATCPLSDPLLHQSLCKDESCPATCDFNLLCMVGVGSEAAAHSLLPQASGDVLQTHAHQHRHVPRAGTGPA